MSLDNAYGSTFHLPVMCQQVVKRLITDPNGLYIDLTFGGGGHSRALLDQLGPKGRLIGLDQDADAIAEAQKITDPRFRYFKTNFKDVARFFEAYDWPAATGIFGDLGVSSHQIDTTDRGFGIRLEGPLDMRMDPLGQSKKASDLLNKLSEKDLVTCLATYGEIRNPKQLARQLISYRQKRPFEKMADLRQAVGAVAPPKQYWKYLAQVAQSLRIKLNEELQALELLLAQLPPIVKPGGRVVMLAYHSLEDRLIKRYFRTGDCFKTVPEKTIYGEPIRPFKPLIQRVERPSEAEIATNRRARSARLRTAVRL